MLKNKKTKVRFCTNFEMLTTEWRKELPPKTIFVHLKVFNIQHIETLTLPFHLCFTFGALSFKLQYTRRI
jgi:hypothetical protein